MTVASATATGDETYDFTALLATSPDRPPIERLLSNTVEHAPVGIAFAKRDGGFIYCNRAFCALLGCSTEELADESITSLTHPEDLESTATGLGKLWRGEIDHLDVEKRYLCKDGSALWVRVTASLVRCGGDEPQYAVEFLRDISARKEIAAALLQNRTLLATVIAELPLALVACDVSGQITHYNRAAVHLLGIRSGDSAGSGPPDPYPITSQIFLPDGTTPVVRENRPLARALSDQDSHDVELTIVRPDGAARVTVTSSQRLTGPAGEPLGALAVVQDITEQRLAEAELERVHKQLLVASRQAGMAEVATNVLHNVGNVLNSVNVSASLVADRIKKSKSTGLTRLAALLNEHATDLVSFVTSARGEHLPAYLTELASELAKERDSAMAELDELRSNIEHIKEIVAVQQNYARRGGMTEVLDIRELVEDSLQLNKGSFNRHGVAVVREFEDVPRLQVDKHKVLQILVNVIRNAKYACDELPGGEKRVTVRVRKMNQSVLVEVIDTGVGIPPENLERIFNHGFTTRPDGHGFGLHSSALAAKELGGTLRAESAGHGRGALFVLTLPIPAVESLHVG